MHFEKQALRNSSKAPPASLSGSASRSAWKTASSGHLPIEDSPAFRPASKSGDLIVRIEETAVRGLTLDQAVKRMRGDPDAKVNLSIYRRTSRSRSPSSARRS